MKILSFALISLIPASLALAASDDSGKFIANKQMHALYLRQQAEQNIENLRADKDQSQLSSAISKKLQTLEPAAGTPPPNRPKPPPLPAINAQKPDTLPTNKKSTFK